MAIQNNINQMIGTIAAASTMGKHIANQEKELNVKKVEAANEVLATDKDLIKNTQEMAKTLSSEQLEQAKMDLISENKELSDEKIIGRAKTNEFEKLSNDVADARKELDNYKGKSKRALNKLNENLEMAEMAQSRVQNELDARFKLQQNMNVQKARLEALGVKEKDYMKWAKGGKR